MHALAIDLHKNGNTITGSDDQVFEPARSSLKKHGLLPKKEGWFADKISNSVDCVVLGMHAKKDNPELERALKLDVPVLSFPEFIAKLIKDKKKIVVAGSHGKTTVTSMIMHVLRQQKFKFDYLVGAKVPGFSGNVHVSPENDLAVLEGDEYITSALDDLPKILWYKPEIAVLTGIAWDHINVFKTEDQYIQAFLDFLESLPENAMVFYNKNDSKLQDLIGRVKNNVRFEGYDYPEYEIRDETPVLTENNQDIPLQIRGKHNLQNLAAARKVCMHLGIDEPAFLKHISEFEGPGKRLEFKGSYNGIEIFRDFAHSPSKVRGVLEGLRDQYKKKKMLAVFEFHTYSSLDESFIPFYKECFDQADEVWFFTDRKALQIKNKQLPDESLLKSLTISPVKCFYAPEELQKELSNVNQKFDIWIFMSSGNLGGVTDEAIQKIAAQSDSIR